jgi:putative N6-adenine-specific DNA methylase
MEQGTGSAFSKRIKRHIVGCNHLFFVSTSPGLSRLCLKELESTISTAGSARIVSGGIEFKGRLIDCYAANLNLRTANRILMRIHSFKATNFRQLEKNLSRMPWELHLYRDSRLCIRVTTRHSRLFHSEAISQKVRQCIVDRCSEHGVDSAGDVYPKFEQTVYIRALDDRMTVSIDSSGTHLHKRGLKTYPGRAPMRETLAAAVLKWAEYQPGEPLLDPMCGSGTFSMEAAFLAKQAPAGYFRSFAFMGWPGFRPRQWEYLKRASEKKSQQIAQPFIFASDRDPALVRRVEKCTLEYGFADAVKTLCKDFFSFTPKEMIDRAGLVVLNPPYGHRIGKRRQVRLFYDKIFDKLAADYSGWKCALVLPDSQMIKGGFIQMKFYPLYHGGLNLKVLIGRIP